MLDINFPEQYEGFEDGELYCRWKFGQELPAGHMPIYFLSRPWSSTDGTKYTAQPIDLNIDKVAEELGRWFYGRTHAPYAVLRVWISMDAADNLLVHAQITDMYDSRWFVDAHGRKAVNTTKELLTDMCEHLVHGETDIKSEIYVNPDPNK